MGKAGKVNVHILEPSPRYTINEYDSMEAAIKHIIYLHDMETGKDITKTLKVVSGPYPDMGFDHTKLLIIDDMVVGSVYEYQDENDVRPCNRSANERENYILYRSFNIFTGTLGKNRHRFKSFDEMLNYFETNNNFKKDEIVFGELDNDIKIDGWYSNRAWGVYHITTDGSIAILGYAVIFGDLAMLGKFTEIDTHTIEEKSSITERMPTNTKKISNTYFSENEYGNVTSARIYICPITNMTRDVEDMISASDIPSAINELYVFLRNLNVETEPIKILDEPFKSIGYTTVKLLMMGNKVIGSMWISYNENVTIEPAPMAAKKDDTKREDAKPQTSETVGLRKCMITDIRSGIGRCAYFHRWVKVDNQNYDTVALVEYADGDGKGACTLWPPHHIRFIDV